MRNFRVRKIVNATGLALALVCLILALLPLGAMLAYVLGQGGSSLDLAFFTHGPVPTGELGGGMRSDILGTLYLIVLASLLGLPVGILSGIYLSRSLRTPFATTVRFFADVIAGTPSIVAGVVAYALVVIPMGRFSAFAGGVALALLMFPTVTRATEEAIRLVPGSIKEAALALGLSEWKTMLRVVLPAAANGIVTAIMLGIARVAGETAPLLFTAFGNDLVNWNPGRAVGALPLQIFKYATGPYDDWHRQAWAGAFVLFAIVFALNLTARLITFRLTSRTGTG